ncbi:MAG TPA: TIM barrel protein [Thermotogota bacterium]|nr:TIM barrel protein [Thermotogota bacterium]HRW92511.1 TIM barrel protein [Thermotogota bacterium]
MERSEITDHLSRFRVEVPSWGFGASGTRFGTFHVPGEARDIHEKIEDAATVARLTGGVSSLAIHIPWDRVDDFAALRQQVESQGLRVGAVNPNLFGDQAFRFGSLSNVDRGVRQRAIDHCLECIDIMKQTGSKTLSLWLPDGSNYPGQSDMLRAFETLLESLQHVVPSLPEDALLLLEYKFFEPAFYHTVLSDWGTALLAASKLGPKAKVLVDLGHHPQGTNIEYIVDLVSAEGKLGGFHFNSRKYADDDLTVGSLNPYELFLIFVELTRFFDLGQPEDPAASPQVSLVLDQSHNVKSKVKATIQSVVNLQKTFVKALLVNKEELESARQRQDAIGAEEVLKQAFEADVNPYLLHMRSERGLAANPLEEFAKSGLEALAISQRG